MLLLLPLLLLLQVGEELRIGMLRGGIWEFKTYRRRILLIPIEPLQATPMAL